MKLMFCVFYFLFIGIPALAPGEARAESKHSGETKPGTVQLPTQLAEGEGIRVAKAGPGEIQENLTLNGEVSFNGDSIVHVAPRFPGILKKVERNLGDEVKAGDLLAVIQSNESLSTYEIRAEVAGTVIEKDATRGEFVKDDKNLFTIADLSVVWINAAVYPDQLSRVRVGNQVTVRSASAGLQEKAAISYVRLSLSEITRTALARIVLNNSSRSWIPGMLVRVNVVLSAYPVPVAVPRSAVQMVNNVPSVFRVAKADDGHQEFELLTIALGREDDQNVEITQGILSGDRVAAGNTFLLKAELGKGSAAHED